MRGVKTERSGSSHLLKKGACLVSVGSVGAIGGVGDKGKTGASQFPRGK